MKALTDRIVYVAALNSYSTRGQIKRLADIGFSDKDLLDAGFLEEDVREAMELEEEQELE
jgi:hypothetical protein